MNAHSFSVGTSKQKCILGTWHPAQEGNLTCLFSRGKRMDNACNEQLSKSCSNCLRCSRCKKRPVKNLKQSYLPFFKKIFHEKNIFQEILDNDFDFTNQIVTTPGGM